MKQIKSNWKWLVPMLILALVGGFLTMDAGAANTSADNNFKTRYSTDVTITNLEQLVGSGATGTSGQVPVHDGTDYEPKTVTASGASSGTLASTGALVLTQNVNTVGTNNIIDNTVSSADILNGAVALIDMASDSVNAAKIVDNTVSSADILNSTIAATDIAANALTSSDAFLNTVTATVVAGQTGIDTIVEPGSILIDSQPVSGINNDISIEKSIAVTIGDGTVQWILNTTDAATNVVVNGIFWRPAP